MIRRLFVFVICAFSLTPFALAACSYAFVDEGIFSGCVNTVDCGLGGCTRGPVEWSWWYCEKQGDWCCDCYATTRPCRKLVSGEWQDCGGYFYDVVRGSYQNANCGAVTVPHGQSWGGGSRCFAAPG